MLAATASALLNDCQNCGDLMAETPEDARVTVKAVRTTS